jgi:hypothetical protein
MDLQRYLTELHAERERIEQAILALESLSKGAGARRGRPPKWLADLKQKGEAAAGAAVPKAKKAGRRRGTKRKRAAKKQQAAE